MGKGKIAGIIIGAVAVIVMGGGVSWSGETTVYATSGYFTWNEKIAGRDFINERGMMTALGIARSGIVLDMLPMEGLVEVWGGNLDYDGHDVTNSRPLYSDTTYLGTREEITAAGRWPVAGKLAAGPLVGAGHKFWIRTRSSEDWNLVYGKFGGTAAYADGEWQLLVKGGIAYPLYTRSHVSLESAGYEDVVTRPRGEAAPLCRGVRPPGSMEPGGALRGNAVRRVRQGRNTLHRPTGKRGSGYRQPGLPA